MPQNYYTHLVQLYHVSGMAPGGSGAINLKDPPNRPLQEELDRMHLEDGWEAISVAPLDAGTVLVTFRQGAVA